MCCSNTLYNDLLHWIANITKIELNEHSIDMSSAKYTNTGIIPYVLYIKNNCILKYFVVITVNEPENRINLSQESVIR